MSTGLWVALYTPTAPCTPIPLQTPEKANHGWNVWNNDVFISFTPEQIGYCIEAGWEPIGATLDEDGHALFAPGSSGVVIKTSKFISHSTVLQDGQTAVRVLYPATLPEEEVAEYLTVIDDTFRNIGSLYKDFQTPQLNGHTVLIAVGIAGDGTTVERSIYPTPTKDLTIFARNINHRRSEELFIHAIAHLYNRHFTEGLLYQQNQTPIPAEDWQELEASWTEIIFRSDNNARTNRIEELHAIHASVVTNVFSPMLDFPFNDRKIYEEVRRKSVILGPNPTYAEVQYSHYILAPLLLLAIEGLLKIHSTETSVSVLLTQARKDNVNFFVLVSDHLPKDVMPQIDSYIFGREQIPFELLEAGLAQYEQ